LFIIETADMDEYATKLTSKKIADMQGVMKTHEVCRTDARIFLPTAAVAMALSFGCQGQWDSADFRPEAAATEVPEERAQPHGRGRRGRRGQSASVGDVQESRGRGRGGGEGRVHMQHALSGFSATAVVRIITDTAQRTLCAMSPALLLNSICNKLINVSYTTALSSSFF
jgi:hypothetical protein